MTQLFIRFACSHHLPAEQLLRINSRLHYWIENARLMPCPDCKARPWLKPIQEKGTPK